MLDRHHDITSGVLEQAYRSEIRIVAQSGAIGLVIAALAIASNPASIVMAAAGITMLMTAGPLADRIFRETVPVETGAQDAE